MSVVLVDACGRVGYDTLELDASTDSPIDLQSEPPFDDAMAPDLGADIGLDMEASDLGADFGTDMGLEPGIVATPTDGLITSESGASTTFTVRLTSAPSAEVAMTVTSDDEDECAVSPSTLIFTPINWAAPQTVTVTGVDDFLVDGDQNFAIELGPVTSTDLAYAMLPTSVVGGTNHDDDAPAIHVTPVSGLVTSEGGATATFSVVLANEPAEDVSVPITSSDVGEGTVAPAGLVFTQLNWNAPQIVTVTGADDFVADGNVDFTVLIGASTSADPAYDGIDAADVSVNNVDDETPGIVVTPTNGLVTAESGLVDTFTVRLATQPVVDVILHVASLDTSEGTVSPSTLTFTSMNWDAMQTVTVAGVDDVIIDGSQMYEVEVAPDASSDADYAAMPIIPVNLTNTDNETAGVTITPSAGLEVSEMGDTATFVVTLNSMPTASVLMPLTSTDTSEGTISPGTVMFSPATWSTPRTVTITGINDAISDGNQLFTITTGAVVSGDSDYAGIDPTDVSVTNIDDDSPSVIVAPLSISVSESGAASSFSVRLGSMPTASVAIPIASNDATEATSSVASLTFSTLNYATPQIVTVNPVNDAIADGNQSFVVVLSPPTTTDPTYAAIDPTDVVGTNVDDDVASILVTPTSGLTTSEAGASAAISVRLGAVPTANVTILVSSSDTTEGTASPASLVFTPLNGTNPLTITATGVNDLIADGDVEYAIVLAPATSTDAAYAGMDASDVAAINLDNDVPAFVVTPTTISTSESGTTAMFTVALTTMPSADVVVGISSSNAGEATVAPATLTFTAGDFSMPHAVTVTGVQDVVIDGTQPYTIITAPATSTDPAYNGRDPANVSGSNTDDDFVVTNTSVNSAGVQADAPTGIGSNPMTISFDGRYVAYRSVASNLVAGDTNNDSDIFVRDVLLGTTERISIGTDGTQATAGAFGQVMTGDARYVLFTSAGGATWSSGGQSTVWLRDRMATTSTASALTTVGTFAPGAIAYSISNDGRYFAFASSSSGIVPGDTNVSDDIFIRDRVMGVTTRQTVKSGGGQTNGGIFVSMGTRISDDGRYLLFGVNENSDVVPELGRPNPNVVLRDTVANTTTLISLTTSGVPGQAEPLDMTPDGRYIVFASGQSAVFMSGDTNAQRDIYVYDRLMAAFEIASRTSSGALANGASVEAAISDDGRYVAFQSYASNLVSGDTNNQSDIFVRDRLLNTTQRQSIASSGAQGNSGSFEPVISGDGQWVLFYTLATNIIAGDVNGHQDVVRVPRL